MGGASVARFVFDHDVEPQLRVNFDDAHHTVEQLVFVPVTDLDAAHHS